MKSTEIRIYRLLNSLESLSRDWLITIATGVVFILGVIDYLTGFELSFSFFYLIPVAMAAWMIGRNAGLVISVLCATAWLTSNSLSGHHFSNLFIGIWNTFFRFGFYAVVTILLAELRHALEEERLLTNTDPLTGALNRRSFNEIAEKKMISAEVNKHPYTMVYIDLDNFKIINDTLGYTVGDLVLKSVVDAIQAQIRNTDFLARLGGDEFAVLLTNIDQEQAKLIVQRLHSSLTEKMETNNWEITFSIGVLTVLSMPESVDKLVSLTDTLMYEVKASGKNAAKYSIFE
ncbi:MAG TPA: GGDEF domain-containing protein [Anaerolineales bacterium]|nr:GGDEF domain-containing protein [Anaerolineales bacterium]